MGRLKTFLKTICSSQNAKTSPAAIHDNYKRPSIEVHRSSFKVSVTPASKDDRVCFYLMKTGQKAYLEKSDWVKRSSWEFHLKTSGTYYCKVTIISAQDKTKTHLESHPVDFKNEDDTQLFLKWCEKHAGLKPQADPFHLFLKKEPFWDFAILRLSDASTDKLGAFTKRYGLFCSTLDVKGGQLVVVSSKPLDRSWGLSGVIFDDEGDFIFGKDIDALDDAEANDVTASAPVGYFTYFKHTQQNELEIGTDYFGQCLLHYYAKNDDFACTNNYHLLLLLLYFLGKPLSLNEELILADLCRYAYSMTDECMVNEIRLVPMGKMIRLDVRKASFVPAAIQDDLASFKKGITKAEYEKLLCEGAEALKAKLRSAIDDDRIDRVILDVTGGLDSRINVAVLSQVEKSEKMQLRSEEAFNADYAVFKMLLPYFSYPVYAKQNPKSYISNPVDYLNDYISHFLLTGTYGPQLTRSSHFLDPVPKTVHYSGSGEYLTRTYFTRRMMKDDGVFTWGYDRIVDKSIRKSDILSARAYESCWKKLRASLDDIPGETPVERIELHFTYHENRMHIPRSAGWTETIELSGIVAKPLFELNRRTWHLREDVRPALELTSLLDADIASVPYAYAINEDAKLTLHDSLVHKPKEETRSFDEIPDPVAAAPVKHPSMTNWEEEFEAVLAALVTDERLKDAFGFDVWNNFMKTDAAGTHDRQQMYFKLLAVYYHACLCGLYE